MTDKLKLGSALLHDFQRFEKNRSHHPSLHLTSSFDYDTVEDSIEVFRKKKDGHVYSRYGNPNIESIAQKIADLEGIDIPDKTKAFFTTNGMSAIYTVMRGLLLNGGKVLTQGDLYGGTTELFNKVLASQSSEILLTDFNDLEAVQEVLFKNDDIRVIYLETPTNPVCTCVDLEAIAIIAKSRDVITVVDNTFCTPYLQRPLSLGIDFVIHSTTKYLNGHGTGLGGCIVGKQEHPAMGQIWEVMKLIGSTGTPFDAWLVQNGIKTLKVRMDQHCKNAMALSTFLESHSKVKVVHYPGLTSHPQHPTAQKNMTQFGGMLSFELNGGQEEAFKVMNTLKMATIAPTLGDVDTLVLHPATSSHLNVDKALCESFGITDGLIRVSVGIEDVEDIIADFKQALS